MSEHEEMTFEEMRKREQAKEDTHRRNLLWERSMEAYIKTMEVMEQAAITGFYLQISKVGLMFAIWITLWIKL